MIKKLSLVLALLAGFMFYSPHLDAAATLDQAVCSTADKSGGNPSLCDGQELVDSANQELVKLYGGTILPVTVGGTANAITGTTTPAATALVDGEMRQLKPVTTNTSTVTYNDNSLGAKQVVSSSGATLGSGDLRSDTIYLMRYYATNDEWRVMTPLGSGTLLQTAIDTSAELRTILTDEGGTGAAMFGLFPSMSDDLSCTASQVVRRNAGDTAFECATFSSGGLASTDIDTSAELLAIITDETGTGAAVFATSPALVTPTLGVASATSVNKVTITAPATGSTLTIPDGVTLTGPAASGTAMTLGNAETVTGVKTFGAAGNVGKLAIAGTTSGSTVLNASATASGTLTLPAATDTLVGQATTDTLTNKTINLGSNTLTATSAQLITAISDETGTGSAVFATSPTLVTPNLGTPSAATLTNATGLPVSTGIAGLGVGVATALATPSSANVAAAVTGETGSGALVFATSPALVTPDLGTPSAATLTNATGLPVSTGIAGLGTGVATALATPSSANLRSAVTDEEGTGALMFGITAGMADDITCTGSYFLRRNAGDTAWECAAISGGGDALTSNPLSQFAATTSSQLAGVLSDETGSGAAVFATSPTLVTPALGTPSSGTMTNVTGLPISTGVAGLGTGVATALAVNVGTAGAPVVNGGALGTPSSGTLTNATGLPISSGVSGLGTGVATALATFSSANLRSAATDEVGTGSLMFGLAPGMADDLTCTGSQVVRRNAGDTAFECATVSGTGDMVAANNLSDVASAATAFANIKQAATTTATGVVELATTAEATTGTDSTRAVTPDGLAAAIAASTPSFHVNIQTFTASGTYTPTAGLDHAVVECTGGGGGGGSGTSNPGAGNGGSGAGTSTEEYSAATIGASQTVTIGAGGAGNATGAGADGGDTTFGALMTATKGVGGAANTSSTLSAGGIPTGGDVNITGGDGGSGATATGWALGGIGGGTYWGPGGAPAFTTSAAVTGGNGQAYGSGGAGGATNTTGNGTGGNGKDGICVVTEYY